MFDQLIYVAIAGAIVVAILALLKVMIDYPGMGDMCMRFLHKKTAPTPAKTSGGIEEIHEVDIKMMADTHENVSELGLSDAEMGNMSRISTDPEICRKRLEDFDEIMSADNGSHSRLTGVREKVHEHGRRLSHDHHHHHHEKKHHHDYHRRHSHDHHHRHHHHHDRRLSHHHHRHGHGHHSSTESDSSPARRKESKQKLIFSERSHHHREVSITPEDSQEKVNRESPSSNSSLEKLKGIKSNNMRININNVNILINRTHHQDVTINIDMDEAVEAEVVEVPEVVDHDHDHDHDHDQEVRSSDSGIGWDEHHVHDNLVPEIQVAAAATPTDIQTIAEEDQASPSDEVQDEAEPTKEKFFNRLVLDSLPISMPKRFRHNTYN